MKIAATIECPECNSPMTAIEWERPARVLEPLGVPDTLIKQYELTGEVFVTYKCGTCAATKRVTHDASGR